jgi:hypothetical protein
MRHRTAIDALVVGWTECADHDVTLLLVEEGLDRDVPAVVITASGLASQARCASSRDGRGRRAMGRCPRRPSSRGGGNRRGILRTSRFVLRVQFGLQEVPDSGLGPAAMAPPAGDPRTEAEVEGQVAPGDPGVEDEQDALQALAVIERNGAAPTGPMGRE